MHSPARSSFFLSLKWKALLLSSIALILVTSALVTINHIELYSQFERRRAELQSQYAHQVQGLLDQSDKRLRQWSTIIASLLSVQTAAEKQLEEQIITEFERLAAILELDMGAESILLVSAKYPARLREQPAAGSTWFGCALRQANSSRGGGSTSRRHREPHQPDRLLRHLPAIRHRSHSRH